MKAPAGGRESGAHAGDDGTANMHRWLGLLLGAILLWGAAQPAGAVLRIGVIVSATGAASALGMPQRNAVALLPRRIGGEPVEYVVLDDNSDPVRTVALVRALLRAPGVDALIGPTTTPASLALLDFVADAQVPMLTPAGSSLVVQPLEARKRWAFKLTPSEASLSTVLLRHMARHGVRRLALIGFTDTYGESWRSYIEGAAPKAGVHLLLTERYGRMDQTVMGQVLNTMAAKPDGVLIAASGLPALLPQVSLRDKGYRGPIYQTMGASLGAFPLLAGKAAEGTWMVANPVLVADQLPPNHPLATQVAAYAQAYRAHYRVAPEPFGGYVFDAGLLLQAAVPQALTHGRPGTPAFRQALRNALEHGVPLAGCQGIYRFTRDNHNGPEPMPRAMMQLRQGHWVLAPD